MLDVRQLVKGVISPPFENPLIESKLSPSEGLIIKHFSGDNKPEKRKKYLKKYLKGYFKDKKRKELIFTKKEYSILQKIAKQHNTKVGSFAKKCVFSYLDKKYILPDQKQLNRLELDIKKIGNNINQVAKHSNKVKTMGLFDAMRINTNLLKMEEKIDTVINQPSDLLEEITKSIRGNPQMIYNIEMILYKQKLKELTEEA